MTEPKTYTGGCHCGRVRYEVKTDISNVISCNCSICTKTGTLLAFVPASQFKLVSGQDNLTDYLFNKEIIHHLFCATCGVRSFATGTTPDGAAMRAVNVRCLDDVDLSQLTITAIDGRSR